MTSNVFFVFFFFSFSLSTIVIICLFWTIPRNRLSDWISPPYAHTHSLTHTLIRSHTRSHAHAHTLTCSLSHARTHSFNGQLRHLGQKIVRNTEIPGRYCHCYITRDSNLGAWVSRCHLIFTALNIAQLIKNYSGFRVRLHLR